MGILAVCNVPDAPQRGQIISLRDQLIRWLFDHALPLWAEHGVDRQRGGFFESIDFDPIRRDFAAAGEVRRGRVVARQIFVFRSGRRLGWRPADPELVIHGCHYLFSRLHRNAGQFHTAVDADSGQSRAPFSLYEYAFYLFALAHAIDATQFPIAETAALSLRELQSNWANARGGFEESMPRSVPLKSNPHMHLLEAALAWIEVDFAARREPWVHLARGLVHLCLKRFIDPATGVLREYFDDQWRPMPGDAGRIAEPGHQFEWAWLLMRWANSPHGDLGQRQACLVAARRLVDAGERGVDALRGVAINEMWDDLTVKDDAAKLWPQTERVKAWCAMLLAARNAGEAELACAKLAASIHSLMRYFHADAQGLWHESMLPDGTFGAAPCKASSFYHIVCAIETVEQTVAARWNDAPVNPPAI